MDSPEKMRTEKNSSVTVQTKRTDTEMSASTSQENNSVAVSGPDQHPKPNDFSTELPCWFPRCCGRPILYGKPEALGWLLGMTGQTLVLLGVATFLIPALVTFARMEVGCATEIPEGEDRLPECNKKVRGFVKPSSMITTTTSILSLCVAFFTPLFGAIVDYTHHRRTIGRVLAALYVCVLFPQIFISENTWFPLVILLLAMALIAVALTLVLHAYLPELTEDEDELNDLTKVFLAGPGITVIVFVVAVIGISIVRGVDGEDGPTAQIAAVMGLVSISFCFTLAWGVLLQPRPATHTLREGQSLLTSGFTQIIHTIRKLHKHNKVLLWFFAAVALGDVKPLTGIALAFLSENQQFSSADVGIAAIVLLVSVIPGAALSGYFNRKINPIKSSILSLILMSITTCVGAVVLTGPGQKIRSYAIIAGWGIFGGWKTASTNMLVAAILPTGQDTELMGFYLFSDTSLSWLPPLIFTSLNEAGLTQRVGLSSVAFFFVVGILMYLKMGSYEDAVKAGNRMVAKEDNARNIMLQLAETEEETNVPIDGIDPDAAFMDNFEQDDKKKNGTDTERPPYNDIRGVEITRGQLDV